MFVVLVVNAFPCSKCREVDTYFKGMFCGSFVVFSGKVVSTALLQIFGRQIAEVPLVATSPIHRKQVMSISRIKFYTTLAIRVYFYEDHTAAVIAKCTMVTSRVCEVTPPRHGIAMSSHYYGFQSVKLAAFLI